MMKTAALKPCIKSYSQSEITIYFEQSMSVMYYFLNSGIISIIMTHIQIGGEYDSVIHSAIGAS